MDGRLLPCELTLAERRKPLSRQRTRFVGVFLILGAAIGFTLGLILADTAVAATFGAAGAGLGIVIGAIIDQGSRRERDGSQQR